MIWYDNGLQTELVSANPESCTKLKLFLCSRDIQVGDRVETIRDTKGIVALINDKGVFVKIDDFDYSSYVDKHHHYKKESVYKVIGEISPEATWVTEGMEFEEDEIFRCFVHENVSKLSDPMKREVQIKGPCGHFH